MLVHVHIVLAPTLKLDHSVTLVLVLHVYVIHFQEEFLKRPKIKFRADYDTRKRSDVPITLQFLHVIRDVVNLQAYM